jgi:short-subunit dehydrogenase
MGLVEAWRAEFVRYGIDVVSTVPGLTRTGLHDRMLRNDGKMEIPFDDAMAADEVAAATLTAIRKGTTEVWLGRETKQILRLNKWAPRLTTKLIAKRVRRLYADS